MTLRRPGGVSGGRSGTARAAPRILLLASAVTAALASGAGAQELPAPQVFRDRLADGTPGPELVVIPAGRFRMGDLQGDGDPDERPAREVTFPRPFAIGRYEVTFDEYEQFCRATGNPVPDDSGFGRGRRPVVSATWQDALAYGLWLSEQTGQRYRLPSEAEWEYAARGGTVTRFWWGDEPGTGRANCSGCDASWDGDSTAPVGRLAANPFGLYDVLGNLWEWTADCYHSSYEGVPSDGRPHVYRDCGQKVIRGGSWVVPPREIRAANRWRVYPMAPSDEIGFRVVREIEAGPGPGGR
ncbi:MAG: formylglycine-generating enzyme family protein [Myxococcota bacterium]|nr:formylglycine-generating enzyme family protein [Myxococcota bacterium]